MTDVARNGHAPVAVVVVTWNSERYIEECLASLLGLTRRPAEIVVVDNASADRSVELVRSRFPGVRCLALDSNVGFCRANNLGIRSTRAPFVLVLNPDTRLGPAFLAELLPAFDDPCVGMAAGKLLRFDGATLDSCGQSLARSRQPVDRGYGRADRGQFDRDEPVFGVCGAAALYRRSMLEAVALGPGVYFDEAYFAFYEDLDLAWRAQRRGWRAAYRHLARGLHARGGSVAATPGRQRLMALWARSPEVRFHVAKNRGLTLLRNESARGFLANLPFILIRDLATFVWLLLSSPSVLVRLWRVRDLFRTVWRARRLDSTAPAHHVEGGGPQGRAAAGGEPRSAANPEDPGQV